MFYNKSSKSQIKHNMNLRPILNNNLVRSNLTSHEFHYPLRNDKEPPANLILRQNAILAGKYDKLTLDNYIFL